MSLMSSPNEFVNELGSRPADWDWRDAGRVWSLTFEVALHVLKITVGGLSDAECEEAARRVCWHLKRFIKEGCLPLHAGDWKLRVKRTSDLVAVLLISERSRLRDRERLERAELERSRVAQDALTCVTVVINELIVIDRLPRPRPRGWSCAKLAFHYLRHGSLKALCGVFEVEHHTIRKRWERSIHAALRRRNGSRPPTAREVRDVKAAFRMVARRCHGDEGTLQALLDSAKTATR